MPVFLNHIFDLFARSNHQGYYINALEISGEPAEWIRIVPVGDFPEHHNGAHTITREHIRQMAANFSASGTDLLFDIDHGSLGGPTKAAGWSGQVEAREDGLYAKYPSFTPAASESIKNKEYRYFSPVYSLSKKNKQGNEIGAVVDSVALTNRPYMDIEIDPIGNSKSTNTHNSNKTDMNLSDESLKKLGLAADASEEDINQAILNMAASTADGKRETTDEEPTLKSPPKEGNEASKDEDPNGLEAKINSLQKRLDEKESSEADQKAEAYINSALENGKINPSDKDAWINSAKADFDGTKKILDERKNGSAMPGKVAVDEDGAADGKKVNTADACADYLRGQMQLEKKAS